MFNPSKKDLSENPPTPENLLRGFHGRGVQHRKQAILPIDSVSGSRLLGRSNVIFYISDKRDPKDPVGEGAQGHIKRFYHDQKPESYLYVIPQTGTLDEFQNSLVAQCQSSGLKSRVVKKGLFPRGPMPSQLVELGELEKVELSIGGSAYELEFEGYHLFVWDNMRTLMALPIHGGRVTNADIYIWCSNHTKVNWRGIID